MIHSNPRDKLQLFLDKARGALEAEIATRATALRELAAAPAMNGAPAKTLRRTAFTIPQLRANVVDLEAALAIAEGSEA